MKLSVIIPCYNFENYIEDCILSVLNQITEFDFEIIVGDDCSEDGSISIIESIKNEKIRIIKNKNNLGFYQNIKNLILYSKGEYISYLDGDDYLTDNRKLQMQVDFLNKNPDYVMHSTGCQYIEKDGKLTGVFVTPLFEDLSIKDLLKTNYVSFGRTFRNIPNIVKDWMTQMPFLDWCLNFELAKYGKIKCEKWIGGNYRITGEGAITSYSENQIMEKNTETANKLKFEFYEYEKLINNKLRKNSIAIIDCFVRNDEILRLLNNCVDRLKEKDIDILLISNTKINLPEKVDYFIYDRRNQLFEEEYTGVRDIDLYKINDIFEAHDIKSGIQRHGLSVLVNMFNSINFAKSIGYTHFYRFEVDDIYGPESMKFIESVPNLCYYANKKALFYYNENYLYEPSNISFHFMYSEIDFFLSKVTLIRNETDYLKFLNEKYGNRNFLIAEEFIYKNLKNNGDNDVLIKDGRRMSEDFTDTLWNTVVSDSNIDTKYRGITTTLYTNRLQNSIVLLSYSYVNRECKRKIEVCLKGNVLETISQNTYTIGNWCYHVLPYEFEEIRVFEGNEFIYSENKQNIKNYIIFK